MQFAKITAAEFDLLRPLQLAYKAEIGEELPSEEDMDRLRKAMEEERIHFFGCFAEDRLLACCSVCVTYSTFNYQPSGVLEDFYILPQFRHQGIARKLTVYAYAHSGIASLTVGCADCDADLYRAIGFGISLGNLLAYGE